MSKRLKDIIMEARDATAYDVIMKSLEMYDKKHAKLMSDMEGAFGDKLKEAGFEHEVKKVLEHMENADDEIKTMLAGIEMTIKGDM